MVYLLSRWGQTVPRRAVSVSQVESLASQLALVLCVQVLRFILTPEPRPLK